MKNGKKSKEDLIDEIQTLRQRIARLESEKARLTKLIDKSGNLSLEVSQRYLDVVHTIVVELNSSGRVVQINKRGCEILGYGENDILGKVWFDKFLPKYLGEEVKDVFKGLMSGRIEAQEFFENPVLTKDGEERLIAWHNTILKGPKGDILGTLSSGLDITNDFYTNEALRKSEERFKMLFERMLDGFALHEIICDNSNNPIDYRFLEINPAFEKMTGLNREIIGKTVKQVLPNIESSWINKYGKVALTGKSIRFENYSTDLERNFDVVAFSPEKGQFATIFIDITDRRKNGDK